MKKTKLNGGRERGERGGERGRELCYEIMISSGGSRN